jgi:hypothetical protein
LNEFELRYSCETRQKELLENHGDGSSDIASFSPNKRWVSVEETIQVGGDQKQSVDVFVGEIAKDVAPNFKGKQRNFWQLL